MKIGLRVVGLFEGLEKWIWTIWFFLTVGMCFSYENGGHMIFWLVALVLRGIISLVVSDRQKLRLLKDYSEGIFKMTSTSSYIDLQQIDQGKQAIPGFCSRAMDLSIHQSIDWRHTLLYRLGVVSFVLGCGIFSAALFFDLSGYGVKRLDRATKTVDSVTVVSFVGWDKAVLDPSPLNNEYYYTFDSSDGAQYKLRYSLKLAVDEASFVAFAQKNTMWNFFGGSFFSLKNLLDCKHDELKAILDTVFKEKPARTIQAFEKNLCLGISYFLAANQINPSLAVRDLEVHINAATLSIVPDR